MFIPLLWIMKKFWNLYVDDFLIEKSINQWVSDRMIEIYHTVFRLVDISQDVTLADLESYTPQNFKRFLWEYFIERNWSSKTYNHYRKYIRCYCEYLKNEWYLQDNPIDRILKRKEAKTLPKTLSSEQVKELQKSLEKTFDMNTIIWVRNKTMVYTYLYTWMRLSELTNLKTEDLRIHDGFIRVIQWKGGKDRLIPLTREAIKHLHNYLKEKKKSLIKSDYIFPTAYWNAIQRKDMQAIIKKIREHISFHFTWHQLRHTYATELVKNNFDIYNISQILGHSTIDTTKIYLSVDTNKLKKQLDKIKLFS